MYGDSRENLLEILAVVIISSPISSVRGQTRRVSWTSPVGCALHSAERWGVDIPCKDILFARIKKTSYCILSDKAFSVSCTIDPGGPVYVCVRVCVCVCVCVYVCVRKRRRGRERVCVCISRERERES